MGQWEPLAERLPVDVRRLATQLRRMKDRSGLTVPALAARTAHPVEGWEKALAGRRLPPLDAVEVLAQASGADYARVDALWRLAEKAAASVSGYGRGKPVPHPDPLDPLGAAEGLPGRRRRILLLATVALLAAAALVAVILNAGESPGRAPGGAARPTGDGPTVTERSATPRATAAASGGRSPSGRPGGERPPDGNPASAAGASDDKPAAGGSLAPSAGSTAPGLPDPSGPGAGAGAGTSAGSGSGSGASSAPPTSPSPDPGPTPSPSASPTHSRLCVGLIVLGICVG